MNKRQIGIILARNRYFNKKMWTGDNLDNAMFFPLEDMIDAYKEGFDEANFRKEVLLKAIEINGIDLDDNNHAEGESD